MTRSLVVDTDTASDDAVALLLAARAPGATMRAVTVVAGNVPLPLATRNALVTLDICGAGDVPVYAGAAAPLDRPLETAQDVHGADGMAGVPLPEPGRGPEAADAVETLVAIAAEEPGRHTLVTLGPLTNIARAVRRDPGFLTRFEHTYLMAGAPDGVGNVNALGEYNVWADPEAATEVLGAEGPKTMIGWNVSRTRAVVTPDEQARLRAFGPLGEFAVAVNADVDAYCRRTGLAGFDLPDPVAMAVALDERLVTRSSPERLVVGLDGPTRGATLPDRRYDAPPPNIRVVWDVDEDAFKRRLFEACAAG